MTYYWSIFRNVPRADGWDNMSYAIMSFSTGMCRFDPCPRINKLDKTEEKYVYSSLCPLIFNVFN